jgi:hypothetical protein
MPVSGSLLTEPAGAALEDTATPAAEISLQALPARTSPADQPTRVADNEPVCGHIADHDRTSPDKGMFTDRYAADHHNSGAQSCPVLHGCCEQFVTVPLYVRTRAKIIGKGDPRTEEDVVGDMHSLEDHHLILDRDPIANSGAVFYERPVADIAITADARAGQNVGKRPHSGPAPDIVAFAQTLRMHEDTVQ